MPEPITPPAPPAPAPAPPAPVPTPPLPANAPEPASADKQPPWGDDANFNPAEAWKTIQNLRKEKGGDADTADLRAQVAAIQEAQRSQNKALAEALGLSEPPKSEDDLTETVKTLQEQFAASQREANLLRIAAEKKIPAEYHDLLTETDPEKLAAQAEKVSALVAALSSAAELPAFQPNPGQGQGGSTPAEDDSYPTHWIPQQRQSNT